MKVLVINAMVVCHVVSIRLFTMRRRLNVPRGVFHVISTLFGRCPILRSRQALVSSTPRPINSSILTGGRFRRFLVEGVGEFLRSTYFSFTPFPMTTVGRINVTAVYFSYRLLGYVFQRRIITVNGWGVVTYDHRRYHLSYNTRTPISIIISSTCLLYSSQVFFRRQL